MKKPSAQEGPTPLVMRAAYPVRVIVTLVAEMEAFASPVLLTFIYSMASVSASARTCFTRTIRLTVNVRSVTGLVRNVLAQRSLTA